MKQIMCIAFSIMACIEGSKLSLNGRKSLLPCPISFYKISSSSSSTCGIQRSPSTNRCNGLDIITSIRGGGLDCIGHLFQSYPYGAAFLVCATKGSCADYTAQKYDYKMIRQRVMNSDDSTKQKQKLKAMAIQALSPFKLQHKRILTFLFYGGLYQGCFQEFLFNVVYPRIFGLDTTLSTAVKKVCAEMFLVSPTLCIPCVYLVKAVLCGHSIRRGLGDYTHDVMKNGILIKYWMIWGPVNMMAFTVIPTHFRISFIAFFSFFWNILLSSISAKSKD